MTHSVCQSTQSEAMTDALFAIYEHVEQIGVVSKQTHRMEPTRRRNCAEPTRLDNCVVGRPPTGEGVVSTPLQVE